MRNLFILALIAFCYLHGKAQSIEPISIQELEMRIARLVEVNDIPAIGLALVDANGHVLDRSFGYENIESQKMADANSMFRLGSISKMFAALAIPQKRDENLLPEFQLTLTGSCQDETIQLRWEIPFATAFLHPVQEGANL